jgi:uncharacterized repeat protein (TIGR04076 family)
VSFLKNGINGDVCIYANYSILSKVFAIMYVASFPRLKESKNPTDACPDEKNPVIYELERIE